MSPGRQVCIHAHFYQPPRENPRTGEIELQESAAPFHDWNQRIAAECYAPNAAAKILAPDGTVARVLNNYSRLSFNFGPTLLSWMERHEPRIYGAVLEADQEGRRRFGGHGPALAQGYNHIILPLANVRDKETQILWGIEDFRARFGRNPEGFWFPEAAVDLESLDLAAREGILFTILSPAQAAGPVETTRPYAVALPSGRKITVFFYDGALSSAVAFENLVSDGALFLRRILDAGSGAPEPRLTHLATDGETYGHHHKFGEMALAFVLDRLDKETTGGLTLYGEYLEKHPPEETVALIENSSWSCAHGVERWRSACGCRTGDHPDGGLEWREALRRSMDRLRDGIAAPYEAAAAKVFKDPRGARNRYAAMLLQGASMGASPFLARELRPGLGAEASGTALALMELQRFLMFMYTSCGWFFDDLGRIEAIQILRYAGSAMELCRSHLGLDLEPEFLTELSKGRSCDPAYGDGLRIWNERVRGAGTGRVRVRRR